MRSITVSLDADSANSEIHDIVHVDICRVLITVLTRKEIMQMMIN